MRIITIALAIAVVTMTTGCLPRTVIKKNPDDFDKGVRYYRPKPYLFLKPLVSKEGMPVSGMVTLNIEMMPDFSEEYSIHVKSGIGTNNTQITLEDGWNLTKLNVDVDSQTDENIEAIAGLLEAIPSLTGSNGSKSMVVRATNVPMGLYEAVISKDAHGRKQLYGFRYVGFLPFATCPTSMHGDECEPCNSDQIYGLVFEDGTMVFRSLIDTRRRIDVRRIDVSKPTEDQLQGSTEGLDT